MLNMLEGGYEQVKAVKLAIQTARKGKDEELISASQDLEKELSASVKGLSIREYLIDFEAFLQDHSVFTATTGPFQKFLLWVSERKTELAAGPTSNQPVRLLLASTQYTQIIRSEGRRGCR